MNKILEISWKTFFKLAISLLLFYFLYQIREILIWILYAFVISILFERPIDVLSKKIKRPIAALAIYFFSFSILIALVYFLSKPLFFEIESFVKLFPQYFERISPFLKRFGLITFETFEQLTKKFQDWLSEASKNIVAAISAIFGGIFSAFSIVSLAMFLSFEKRGIEKLISQSFKEKREWALKIWQEAKEKISAWFGVKILGCLLVAFLTFLSLISLKINYPLSLSALAGILNFVPILGPIAAAILIFIIAALDSLFKGVFFLVFFILIQQIENNFFIPILTKRFIGMPPFLVLVSLLIGGKLLGIGGAILAVPLAGICFKILQEIFKE